MNSDIFAVLGECGGKRKEKGEQSAMVLVQQLCRRQAQAAAAAGEAQGRCA